MSIRARLLNRWLALVERPTLNRLPSDPPSRVRNRFERQARFLMRPPRGSRIQPCEIAGMPGLEVTGPGGVQKDGILLYFHGGGYVIGSPRTHAGLAARLAGRCGLRAVLPDYPLAPEHLFPAAPEAALAAYRACLERGGPIVLAGDSAGGGLALSLLAQITALRLQQPTLTLVLSPWTDLSMSGESYFANASRDVLLPIERVGETRDVFLAGQTPKDPRASPLFAEFTGAAPVRFWVGDTEIFLDDTRRMVARLMEQGVDARAEIASDLPHVWPLFPGWMMPEGEATLDAMAREVQASLGIDSR